MKVRRIKKKKKRELGPQHILPNIANFRIGKKKRKHPNLAKHLREKKSLCKSLVVWPPRKFNLVLFAILEGDKKVAGAISF